MIGRWGRGWLLALVLALVLVAVPRPVLAQSGWSTSGTSVTCSTQDSTNTCARNIDGNTATYWRTDVTGFSMWLQFDLGSSKEVSGFRRYAIGGADYAWPTGNVYVCDDATMAAAPCLTSRVSFNFAGTGAYVGGEIRFPEVTGRYVRVTVSRGTTGFFRSMESQIYFGVCDTCGTATPTPTATVPTATATNTPIPATATATRTATATPTPSPTLPSSGDYIPFADTASYPKEWWACSRWDVMTVPLCRKLDWIHGEGRSTTFGWDIEAVNVIADRQAELYIVPPSQRYDGAAMVVEAMLFSCIARLDEDPPNTGLAGNSVNIVANNTNVTRSGSNGGSWAETTRDVGSFQLFSDPTGSWYDGIDVVNYPGMVVRAYSTDITASGFARLDCNVDEAEGMVDNPSITPGATSVPTATAIDPPTATMTATPTPVNSPTPTGTAVWQITITPLAVGSPWSPDDVWGPVAAPTIVAWVPGDGPPTPETWTTPESWSAPTAWNTAVPLIPVEDWLAATPIAPAATLVVVPYGQLPDYVIGTVLAARPTREFVVEISDPAMICAFEMPEIGPWGGTPIAGIPIPLINFPELNLCTEEYEFNFKFMGWDLGALLTAIVAVLGFGLVWSIIKR